MKKIGRRIVSSHARSTQIKAAAIAAPLFRLTVYAKMRTGENRNLSCFVFLNYFIRETEHCQYVFR
jgi:hypothetical protein